MKFLTILVIFFCTSVFAQIGSNNLPQVKHVVFISIDGLRPDAIMALPKDSVPTYWRLINEGVYTMNARCDFDFSLTMPNHIAMLTGRHVFGEGGHQWTENNSEFNYDSVTIHEVAGGYVHSVYDVIHDAGMRTAFFASKNKFRLFDQSWDETTGAPDTDGVDNGRDKIDTAHVNSISSRTITDWIDQIVGPNPPDFAFFHLYSPDGRGHESGWDITPGSRYSNSVKVIDMRLKSMLTHIDTVPGLKEKTVVIVTADHGGGLPIITEHSAEEEPINFTIPFFVWGAGIPHNYELYDLNPTSRAVKIGERTPWADPVQPIHNADAANLIMDLLGLPSVPNSQINVEQNLNVSIVPDGIQPAPTPIINHALTHSSFGEVKDVFNSLGVRLGGFEAMHRMNPGVYYLQDVRGKMMRHVQLEPHFD